MSGQQLFEHRIPDGTWADLPASVQHAFEVAARERANPTICVNCGRNADFHSGSHNAGCKFTPARALAAVKSAGTKEEA